MPLSQQYVDSSDDSSHSPARQSKTSAKKQKAKREADDESSEDKPLLKKPKKDKGKVEKGSSGSPPARDKKPVKGAKGDERRKVGDSRRASTELLTDDKGESYIDLGKNKRVVISQFKSQTLVQIREYYNDAGQWKPGKKGIALPVDAWDRLKKAVPVIDEAIDALVG